LLVIPILSHRIAGAGKAKHIHDVEGGKDDKGYYGRSIEYTDSQNNHSFHTYYDLERTMETERLPQPKPGSFVSDRLTDFAPKKEPEATTKK
jgi:hypothetical protein